MPRIIPAERSTLAKINRANSIILAQPLHVQYMYSIFLWNIESGELYSDSGIHTSGDSNVAEYYFTVPPKVHEMDEAFNATVTMTQNAGRVVESYGSLIKTINISGTTGFRPHSSGKKYTHEEVTGHDDIISLRNIFRAYSDVMENGDVDIIMVWRNIKDGDYWIVEPKDFKLQQGSNSPLSYNYTIQLQTLAPFDPSAHNSVPDPQATMSSSLTFAQRFRSLTQGLFTEYMRILTVGKLEAERLVIGPAKKVLGSLTAINNETFGAIDFLIESTLDLAFATDACYENYKNLFDPSNPKSNVGDLLNSLKQLKRITNAILSENKFKDEISSARNRRSRISRRYNRPNLNSGTPISPFTGGSSSFIGNTPPVTSTATHVVSGTDDIHSLARRLLGDARRWQEIIILNDLKPPYISIARRPGVLGPGDALLYPSKKKANQDSMVKVQTNSGQDYDNSNVTDSTGLLDQTYGRDIRLISVPTEGEGTTDLTDLDVNQRGDLSTVVGVPNVQQAIRIKFSTERGELRAHPYFGAKFPIGRKATVASFNDFRVNTLATLLSDGRVEKVKNLNFLAEGDLLYVTAEVLLVSSQEYIPASFTLSRI